MVIRCNTETDLIFYYQLISFNWETYDQTLKGSTDTIKIKAILNTGCLKCLRFENWLHLSFVYTSAPLTRCALRMWRASSARLINFLRTWGEQRTPGEWKGHPTHPVLFVFALRTDKFLFVANGMRTICGWRCTDLQSRPHICAFGSRTIRERFVNHSARSYKAFKVCTTVRLCQWKYVFSKFSLNINFNHPEIDFGKTDHKRLMQFWNWTNLLVSVDSIKPKNTRLTFLTLMGVSKVAEQIPRRNPSTLEVEMMEGAVENISDYLQNHLQIIIKIFNFNNKHYGKFKYHGLLGKLYHWPRNLQSLLCFVLSFD